MMRLPLIGGISLYHKDTTKNEHNNWTFVDSSITDIVFYGLRSSENDPVGVIELFSFVGSQLTTNL